MLQEVESGFPRRFPPIRRPVHSDLCRCCHSISVHCRAVYQHLWAGDLVNALPSQSIQSLLLRQLILIVVASVVLHDIKEYKSVCDSEYVV
jgi:hypothetical protein